MDDCICESLLVCSTDWCGVVGWQDFWINASPKLWTRKDQLGNGFMQVTRRHIHPHIQQHTPPLTVCVCVQYYGQDVAAAEADPSAPFDFTADPDADDTNAENLPPLSNYFYYNQVGNVAFVGYSGAHQYTLSESYFESACNWAASTPGIDTILLLGHWNSDGDGCDETMTVPAVYTSIAALPACQPVAAKIRYMLGHAHCNLVVEDNIGFMVGGMGMSDYKCGGTFGIPVVDTTGGLFRVFYFPVQQAPPASKLDQYDEVLSCITEKGVSGCYHLATEWTTAAIV